MNLTKEVENLKERLDSLYKQIGVKSEIFDTLLQQIRDIKKDYTRIASMEGVKEYFQIYNKVNQVICLEGVHTQLTPGTDVEGMVDYILQMKSNIEMSTASLQPFLEMGEALQKTPIFDIETIQKRVLAINERVAAAEMQLLELHRSVCDIVTLYSKTIGEINEIVLSAKASRENK